MNSKRKGNRAELELLHLLEGRGIPARRNDQRYTGGRENPDIGCKICGRRVHVEVKHVERLNIHGAMAQAIRDAAADALPVVVHRRNRSPWLVTMRLDDLLTALEGGADHDQ